jgi:hypothetical protein
MIFGIARSRFLLELPVWPSAAHPFDSITADIHRHRADDRGWLSEESHPADA